MTDRFDRSPLVDAAARAPCRIVVSGFGPWGALPGNPTLAVLDRLAAEAEGADLTTLALSVDTARVDALVTRTLDEIRPTLWIGLGLAVGAAVVAVERIAANILDFAEPDVAGARPAGAPVVAEGPDAYLATLPVAAIVRRLRGAGIPARASSTAGTFLCNQLMYTVLHRIAVGGHATRAGFLHIPLDPGLVARLDGKAAEQPSMSLDLATEAVRLAIATASAPAE